MVIKEPREKLKLAKFQNQRGYTGATLFNSAYLIVFNKVVCVHTIIKINAECNMLPRLDSLSTLGKVSVEHC